TRTSESACTVSAKMEAEIVGMIAATMPERLDAIWLAAELGTYCSSTIASRTRRATSSPTSSGCRKTRDTVCADTPARAATSFIVTRLVAVRRLRRFCGAVSEAMELAGLDLFAGDYAGVQE